MRAATSWLHTAAVHSQGLHLLVAFVVLSLCPTGLSVVEPQLQRNIRVANRPSHCMAAIPVNRTSLRVLVELWTGESLECLIHVRPSAIKVCRGCLDDDPF